jgi:hypothetical protein
MFMLSSVGSPRRETAATLRVDQTLFEWKCRMALETIRNGYRGEQITEEIATPRYRSWEFELRRKATMWINTENDAVLRET